MAHMTVEMNKTRMHNWAHARTQAATHHKVSTATRRLYHGKTMAVLRHFLGSHGGVLEVVHELALAPRALLNARGVDMQWELGLGQQQRRGHAGQGRKGGSRLCSAVPSA